MSQSEGSQREGNSELSLEDSTTSLRTTRSGSGSTNKSVLASPGCTGSAAPHTESVLGQRKRGWPDCPGGDAEIAPLVPSSPTPAPPHTRSAAKATAAADACLAAARQLSGGRGKGSAREKKVASASTPAPPEELEPMGTLHTPSPHPGPSSSSSTRSSRYASQRRGAFDQLQTSEGASSEYREHGSEPRISANPLEKATTKPTNTATRTMTPRNSWLRLPTGSAASSAKGRRVFVSDSDSSSEEDDESTCGGGGMQTRTSCSKQGSVAKGAVSTTVFSRRMRRPVSRNDSPAIKRCLEGKATACLVTTVVEGGSGWTATSPCASPSSCSVSSPLYGEDAEVREGGLVERVRKLESAMHVAIERLDEQAKQLERERAITQTLSTQLQDCQSQLSLLSKDAKVSSSRLDKGLRTRRRPSSVCGGASSIGVLGVTADKTGSERSSKRRKEHRMPLSVRGDCNNLLL